MGITNINGMGGGGSGSKQYSKRIIGQATITQNAQYHPCKVCSKPISCEKMRGHLAYHIIKLEIESSECGFCGLPSCTNKLVQSSKTNKNKFFKIESNCDYFFSYGRKPVYSKREKCCNHLARCEVTKCSNHLAQCEVTKCCNHLARCEVTKCSNHLAQCEVTKCSNHLPT